MADSIGLVDMLVRRQLDTLNRMAFPGVKMEIRIDRRSDRGTRSAAVRDFAQRRCDLVPARDGGLQADGGRDRLDHTV